MTDRLASDRLYRTADLSGLAFETTADLTPLTGLAEQPRARDAVVLGTAMETHGFNIFVVAAPGARMEPAVRELLHESARNRPEPCDWVYVDNVDEPQKPKALWLPAGRAPEFQKAVHALIADLRVALPAIFESEEYQHRRSAIEQSIRGKGQETFAALERRAETESIALLRTPAGFAMAPVKDGKIVTPDEFAAWAEEERSEVRSRIAALEAEFESQLRTIPRLENELRDAVRALDRETAESAMAQPIAALRARYAELPHVVAHIDVLRSDLVENVQLLINSDLAAEDGRHRPHHGHPFERYEVNVFVTQADHGTGAPVIEELHPTLANLVGRIEYLSVQGALVTNFHLIRPGALHRANGGTITLDARSLLSEPFSWAALKRALLRGEVVIEDVARFMGLTTTVTLEPDPIPLDVKVVLFGDRILYYLLSSLDPEFSRHFKILADFDDAVPRSPASESDLARILAVTAAREGLPPLDRDAVARAIEHAARLADDSAKLTLRIEPLTDLLAEAGHRTRSAGRPTTSRADADAAIAEQIRRSSRIRDLEHEAILRDVALIETAGSRVGQINGLSVVSLGDYAFGRPSRITCRVRPGTGKIVDIEREVELGGPLHSKGVLILGGFLGGRYALDEPMSLAASLVFEQSYGGVEGDSASSAELYALLSALAEAPLRQDLAVTGSVNQHGMIQAIGGVNEKIEGFFDLCTARGLTGAHGVLIPESNVQHLMLRADVVAACAAGTFAVYPVRTIDEGLALLTGIPAGERGDDGRYPADSLNGRIEARLRQFAAVRKTLAADHIQSNGAVTV